MKRRNFLKTTSVGSACAVAGTIVSNEVLGNSNEEKILKVTVLKRTLNKEWNQEFRNMEGQKCDQFTEGQEFVITSPWEPPTGFCPWAWADIRTFIHKVHDGAMDTFVSCCTDGFRPVFFKIEQVSKEG